MDDGESIPVWPQDDREGTVATDDQADADANVRVATQSVADLRATARDMGLDWDELDRDERADVAFAAPDDTSETVSNTACIGLARYLVDALVGGDCPKVESLRVGSGTGTAWADETLTTPEGETGISKRRDDGDTLFVAVFIDTTQFNGITISEVGLDADGHLLNHADGFQSIQKDSGRSVTFEGTLSLGAA